MFSLALSHGLLSYNVQVAVELKLSASNSMMPEVVQKAKLVRNKVVVEQLFLHLIIGSQFVV